MVNFHHIGLAVEDIEDALRTIRQQYQVKEVSDVVYDKNQNARLCMVTMQDGFCMELVAGEVVKSWIKRGQHLYHICYETEDMTAEIENRCKYQGNILVSEPKEAILFHNKKVAFIRTDLGLIELVEK